MGHITCKLHPYAPGGGVEEALNNETEISLHTTRGVTSGSCGTRYTSNNSGVVNFTNSASTTE